MVRTRRSEDRIRYRDHLAAAAIIFERLHHGDLASVKQLISGERRSFGWSFLNGEAGESAESSDHANSPLTPPSISTN
jgi:hypothetical protein